MMDSKFRKTKANWNRPSLNPMTSRQQTLKQQQTYHNFDDNNDEDNDNRNPNSNYRIRTPWDHDSRELVDEFDQQLNILDNANLKHPWEEDSTTLEMLSKQKENAKNYKFQSLFDVPELSEEKKKQLQEYAYNPPYRCEFNIVDEPVKSAKKLNSERKNPKTRAPWMYGDLPAQPITKHVVPQPSTSLWEVPIGDRSDNNNNDNSNNTLDSSGDPVLDNLRVHLKQHGALGISGLARKFKSMDNTGNGALDYQEFKTGMKECGLLHLTEKQLKHLFLFFDRDDSGTITYDEFLVGVRGVMNERRKSLCMMAFKILDDDNNGFINLSEIKHAYNAKFHPDVIDGKKTEDEVLLDFMHTFERASSRKAKKDNNNKGKSQLQQQQQQKQRPLEEDVITPEDWIDYYSNISASIDDDDYFELMIRNAWHISGGKGVYENSTNRRILVTDAQGRQSVQELKDDIRIKKDDVNAMIDNLQKQGINNVAMINVSDKVNPKNTMVNPNIIAIRTKYGGYNEQEEEDVDSPAGDGPKTMMNHGIPPRGDQSINVPNTNLNKTTVPLRDAYSAYKQQGSNRGGNTNNGNSTVPLNAYTRPSTANSDNYGTDTIKRTGAVPNVPKTNSGSINLNDKMMKNNNNMSNIRIIPPSESRQSSRPNSARSTPSGRTLIY